MKVLDLCCGIGGWSKGFAELGHECTGVDIKNHGYPYRFIQADLMTWEPDQHYDIVLASPECKAFSIAAKWSKRNRDVKTGMELVNRTLELIDMIKPKYWVLENVFGLEEYLGKAKTKIRYARHPRSKMACLWGEFPSLPFFTEMIQYKQPHRLWSADPRRAEIPIQLSRAMANVMIV